MAPKSRSILFIFLSILVVAVPILAAPRGTIVGGWRPIDNPKDPEVVMVAKFAVTEHNNQANTSLVFANVVKGELQVVAGTKYRLVISAKDGGAANPKTYSAVVWSKPWQKFLQLLSFEEIKG